MFIGSTKREFIESVAEIDGAAAVTIGRALVAIGKALIKADKEIGSNEDGGLGCGISIESGWVVMTFSYSEDSEFVQKTLRTALWRYESD